jgi:hypothetical protein
LLSMLVLPAAYLLMRRRGLERVPRETSLRYA